MQRLYWNSLTFAPGVHTYESRQQNGVFFARDAGNLRAGPDGYLRLRHSAGFVETERDDAGLSGIGRFDDRLFFIQNNNELRSVALEDLDTFTTVPGDVGRLEGRLWLVDNYNDFWIGKSEGEDRGFWVDMREGHELRAYNLGLAPPGVAPVAQWLDSNAPVGTRVTSERYYVFRTSYIRAFGEAHEVLQGEFSARPELCEGMESNLSSPTIYYIGASVPENRPTFIDKDGNEIEPVASGGGVDPYGVFNPSAYLSDDEQATGIFLYQTSPISERERGTINIDSLIYRRVAFSYETEDDLRLYSRDDDELSGLVSFPGDNSRMPADTTQIAFYNDLIFAAAGNELRYSDVRDGSPVQWAWPEANSVSRRDVVFCAEHRGVLLFGGPTSLHRLTGTDEFNFNVDQYAGIGPVTASAWGRLEQGIGFIAPGGFYVTDGTEAVNVSAPALSGFFEEAEVVDGSVTLLPDGDSLWHVRFEDNTTRQFLLSKKGGWWPWDEVKVRQSVPLSALREHIDKLYYVDSSNNIRYLEWSKFSPNDLVHSNPADVGYGTKPIAWFYETQLLDFAEQGYGEAIKTFRWLEISSSHAGEGILRYWIDEGEPVIQSFNFVDGLRPVRVLILRKGTRIKFRVSGKGNISLRNLRLVADARSARTRF